MVISFLIFCQFHYQLIKIKSKWIKNIIRNEEHVFDYWNSVFPYFTFKIYSVSQHLWSWHESSGFNFTTKTGLLDRRHKNRDSLWIDLYRNSYSKQPNISRISAAAFDMKIVLSRLTECLFISSVNYKWNQPTSTEYTYSLEHTVFQLWKQILHQTYELLPTLEHYHQSYREMSSN